MLWNSFVEQESRGRMSRRALARRALDRLKHFLHDSYPAFTEEPSEAPWVQVFKWRYEGRACVFVCFQFHDSDGAFTIEVARSATSGKFPAQADQIAVEPLRRPKPVRGGLSFRLGEFLPEPRDYWWDLSTGGEYKRRPGGTDPEAGLEIAMEEVCGLLKVAIPFLLDEYKKRQVS